MTETRARTWRVLGSNSCGAAIVESTLALAGISFDRDVTDDPTLTVILPDGSVMTETAAIVLYIDGLVPELGLVPPVKDPLRRDLLRWLMFLVAAVLPTFKDASDEHRQSLWRLVEGSARTPWFLGERPSALDIYVSVMTRWSPGRAWFAENCPRLHAIAAAGDRR